jgi:Xaa-Pro aminopeptidase
MFNHTKRLRELRRSLKSQQLPNLLVTDRTNIFYLTGFTGSAGHLLVTADQILLLTDGRYSTQVAHECPGLDVEIQRTSESLASLLCRVLKRAKTSHLAYEATNVTKAAFDELESLLPAVELISSSGVIEALRAVKDKDEVAAIRKSIRVNERTFEVIRSQLTADQTEREVGFNLEHQMRQFGATECCFDPIVAVGPAAALPHATPGATRIGSDSFVLIDWGAFVDHYASDLTRVIVTSAKIPAKLRKVYDTVLAAQLAAIDAIRPGLCTKEVDDVARKVIEDAGFGKRFSHSLGHGIGLAVHEGPGLRPSGGQPLKAGMVVTVEPGIYIPNWGGVRIEDDILVTPGGCEVLSELPKELDACIVST